MCLTLGLMFSKREKRLAVYEMRNVKLNICVLLVYTHMSTPPRAPMLHAYKFSRPQGICYLMYFLPSNAPEATHPTWYSIYIHIMKYSYIMAKQTKTSFRCSRARAIVYLSLLVRTSDRDNQSGQSKVFLKNPREIECAVYGRIMMIECARL